MYKIVCAFILQLYVCFAFGDNGVSYYINSQTGNDRNSGHAATVAWKTLQNINDRQFLPGDSILFAKGSTFNGGFVVKSSGTAEKNIVFSSYSKGDNPLFTNPDYEVSN